MSKRTELLEKEKSYQKAVENAAEERPEKLTFQLHGGKYGNFGFVNYYPEKDQAEIAVRDKAICVDGDEGLLLLDALKAIYE
jgi:hypothetical protein